MEKILIYPTAVLMAFLPLRYRKRCNLEDSLEMRSAAVVSGVPNAWFVEVFTPLRSNHRSWMR